LEDNESAEKDDIESQKEALKYVWDPIITKHRQLRDGGGMPGAGGMTGAGPAGAGGAGGPTNH
jgi:hypothetical protein